MLVRDAYPRAGAIPHIVEKLSAARPDANVTKAALSCLLTLCHSNVKNKLEVSKVNTIRRLYRPGVLCDEY
jgi:hypothetical protein